MLEARGSDLNVVIAGASGGIGAALVDAAAGLACVARVTALARSPAAALPTGVDRYVVDITDEATVAAAAEALGQGAPVDIVIIATGLLHAGDEFQPEKDWRHLSADRLARSFAVNTIGPALIAKHVLPLMNRSRPGVFAALSARVGSISDNRIGGWYGYRASKAALNMMIRTISIELARKRHPTICVGLHPGTVDTGLSRPFQSGTRPGQVISPEASAANLLRVIAGLGAGDSGHVFAWDGSRIPP